MATVCCLGCSDPIALESPDPSNISITVSSRDSDARLAPPRSVLRFELGEIQAGGVAESVIYLTNERAKPVEIARYETTCECVSLNPWPRDVGPRQRVAAKVKLDLSHEREFTGDLDVEVSALDAQGAELFVIRVSAAVVEVAQSSQAIAASLNYP